MNCDITFGRLNDTSPIEPGFFNNLHGNLILGSEEKADQSINTMNCLKQHAGYSNFL